MPPTDAPPINTGLSAEEEAEMTNYGITCTQVQQFHFGDYRYSSLRDALAQAKRAANAK